MVNVCAAKYETAVTGIGAAVRNFCNTNCDGAKTASLEIIKQIKPFKKWALPTERPVLGELDILLSPAFRSFCECCERKDAAAVPRYAPDLKDQAQRILNNNPQRFNSVLWRIWVEPVAQHVIRLIDEESRQTEQLTSPILTLSNSTFKLDLSKIHKEMTFSCRLTNRGKGLAMAVSVKADLTQTPAEVRIIEPRKEFEIAGESQQVITMGITLREPRTERSIPRIWKCSSLRGKSMENDDLLRIEQQQVNPNWEKLKQDPPYGTNPIKTRDKLFGRDAILDQLLLHASSGTSTFLWGAKRVGKTSVLQVLASELSRNTRFTTIILRMGELLALHEGQIAHTIASRITQKLQNKPINVPSEQEFGAGLSQLIPFVESLVGLDANRKFLVIIDEFDDLDAAFYTGQRGRAFVKALRSLSEIGLTFFFVGSERMDVIYRKHATDLNKWVNVYLDVIESREDCKSLVVKPVQGAIEFQAGTVESMLDYCRGNPFYMQLMCSEIFVRCANEERTYIGESDLDGIKQSRVRTLGDTNFSHFWEDNPELDETEKRRQLASNCLVLWAISALGGRCESANDIFEYQEASGLPAAERLTAQEVDSTVMRLQLRKVLTPTRHGKIEIMLPIFNHWLAANAELRLLPLWKQFAQSRHPNKQADIEIATPMPTVIAPTFVVTEEDLLAVSQSLSYCGRQKDVTELRAWLSQFDDDNRIEFAFLLLKTLAERGFIGESAWGHLLSTVIDHVNGQRTITGNGSWTILKGRIDNLCVSYLESNKGELTSAVTARRIASNLKPGKWGSSSSIFDWMRSRQKQDPMLLFTNDFCGTGETLAGNLHKFFESRENADIVSWFRQQRRIFCSINCAFKTAIQKLEREFPDVHFFAARMFGAEVQALDAGAEIFESAEELRFAKDMLLQLGRELFPQHPLGFNDSAALVCFHDGVPKNTLPIFWKEGVVNDRKWKPLFPFTHNEVVDEVDTVGPKPIDVSPKTNVFISYSHKDIGWLERLRVHLKPVEKLGAIQLWDDRKIGAGSLWKNEIFSALKSARAAILLVSADFLASDFIQQNELPPLLEAAEKQGVLILPLIVSASRFSQTESLSKFQAFNSPSKPLNALAPHEQEQIFVDVSCELERVLKQSSQWS